MNRWLIKISIMVTTVISGCSNQSIMDHSKNNQVSKNVKQEIVVWDTYSEEETKVFENEIIPLFEKEYPNIKVKAVRQSYNEQLKSALIARASAKEAPDVVRMDIAWLPLFAQLGLLYPVDQFKGFKQVTNNLLAGPLKSNFYNGRYYGLPLDTNTKVAIYNKNLLARAGYSEPPHTMDELMKIAKEQPYLIGFQDITSWQLLPYFYALGGLLMDTSATKATSYLNSNKSIQAIEVLRTLYQNQDTATEDKWQGVINGDYLMIDDGPWFYSVQSPQKLQTILDQTVAAPFPVTDGKGSVLGGEDLVITKGAKNPKAAWQFIKWMAGKKPQQLMLKTGLMPVNKKIDVSKDMKDYPYYKAFETGIGSAFLRPPVAEWDKIDTILMKYIQLIFSGKIDASKGLTEAAEQIDPLLKGKSEKHGS